MTAMTGTERLADLLQSAARGLDSCSASLAEWHSSGRASSLPSAAALLDSLTVAAGLFVEQVQTPQGGIEACIYSVRSMLRFLQTATAAAETEELWAAGRLADKVAKSQRQAAQLSALVQSCGFAELRARLSDAQRPALAQGRGWRQAVSNLLGLALLRRVALGAGGALALELARLPQRPWPNRRAVQCAFFLLALLAPGLLSRLRQKRRQHELAVALKGMDCSLLQPMEASLAALTGIHGWFESLWELFTGPVDMPRLQEALQSTPKLMQACDDLILSLQRCRTRVKSLT